MLDRGSQLPPACNTGVHPLGRVSNSGFKSKFDWYRATVPARPESVVSGCLAMAGKGAEVVEGKGRFNYTHSTSVMLGNDRVATVLHGGSNGNPNVEASGEWSPALALMLREGGQHRVTRCDVAIDQYGDGVFADLEKLALRVASDFNLNCRKVGSPLDRTAGETIYLGSRKSAVFARIYEKGKAERGVYGDIDPALLNGWVRCELEVKPQKDMKAQAALMEPDAFWGISAWTMQLVTEAFNMAPEPIPFHPRRTASDDRAFAFMCAQYENLLRRRCLAVHQGNRESLGAEIMQRVFKDDHEAAA